MVASNQERIAEKALAMGQNGPYPPSFDGDQIAYGLALFGLTWIVALGAMLFIQSFGNFWERRQVDGLRDPINANRYIIWGMLGTIMLGAFGDVVILLIWGEVNNRTLSAWTAVDRYLDFLTAVPFTASVIIWARAKPVVNYQLIREPLPLHLWPQWSDPSMQQIRRIALAVAFIALGVSIGKVMPG